MMLAVYLFHGGVFSATQFYNKISCILLKKKKKIYGGYCPVTYHTTQHLRMWQITCKILLSFEQWSDE